MARKIIHFTPDQMGYKDRGKMKWLGLILSDHTESLNKMMVEEQDGKVTIKPKQSLAEISEILAEAYLLKKPVSIQANIVEDGTYLENIRCLVSGAFEEQVFLVLRDGKIMKTTIDDIRYIEFIESNIWYQKK